MSTLTQTILVAEEEDATRVFLYDNLTADGYRVLSARDRGKALALLETEQPDLVLVDVNGQTLGLLDAVRGNAGLAGRADPDTPVIVLTASEDRLQRVRLLERGGDDVILKPFGYPELRARVAAVLRRCGAPRMPRLLRAGPVTVDVRTRQVHVYERAVALTEKEYALLVMLAAEPGRVFTREELLAAIWGPCTFGRTRTLDSHASRLRVKLTEGLEERLVVNVWGVGYRLCDPANAR